ncbi:MAG: hypothetical protein ACODAU_03500 [Myxococcota bacterium]
MTPLTAFVLATPLFGLSLEPPTLGVLPGGSVATPSAVAAAELPPLEASGRAEEGSSIAEQLQQRQKIARIHKWLGIATWSAMTITVMLGIIQYRNLYGFFDGPGGNPCVRGDATFGQGQCTGTPWPHAASAAVTTALYGATFGLSFFMPDPLETAEQDSKAGRRLRAHKRLRWVHFAGMIAQALLGIVVANGESFGLDRANDYRALQGLSTVHLVTGLATYGSLTAAGALMLF